MNEELEKKYKNMTVDCMIEKMEEQETWIRALEDDCKNYRNEQLTTRSRISYLEREYDRLYVENESFVKINEGLDKRVTELSKSVEEKENIIEVMEEQIRGKDATIRSLEDAILDKDDVIEDIQERVNNQKRIIERYDRDLSKDGFTVSDLYPKALFVDPVKSAEKAYRDMDIETTKELAKYECSLYAARMKAKYDSLIKVGFTEDQAISLIPMWTDE